MPEEVISDEQPRQNPEPDAVKFSTGKNDYFIKYGTFWLAQLEDEADETMAEIQERMYNGNVGFSDLLLLLWAGLNGGDRNLRYSQEEAGDILDEARSNRGMKECIKDIMQAMKNAFPEADQTEGRGDTKNNPTGPGSG